MKFQFHKGTIRTLLSYQHNYTRDYFNSIKVRLELPLVPVLPVVAVDFNSIKVRLEQKTNNNISPRHQFQFHKGTIRTIKWGTASIDGSTISIP